MSWHLIEGHTGTGRQFFEQVARCGIITPADVLSILSFTHMLPNPKWSVTIGVCGICKGVQPLVCTPEFVAAE